MPFGLKRRLSNGTGAKDSVYGEQFDSHLRQLPVRCQEVGLLATRVVNCFPSCPQAPWANAIYLPYIYIYTLDSHMVPYVAGASAQSRSKVVQLL